VLQLMAIDVSWPRRTFPVPPGCRLRLGRMQEAEVRLLDYSISRLHAELTHDDRGVWVTALQTRNGTSLNARQLAPADTREMHRWDMLRIAAVALRLVDAGAIDPGWLAHADGAALRLARAIAAAQDFTALPVLGDALEEAGCDIQAVLAHCQGREGIVRHHSWVVDLVLQRGAS
jgi:hypothetical protein